MKHFYWLLILFGNIVTTSYAIQSPVLIFPQANSTVSLKDLSGFTVNPKEPTARYISIRVWLNDPRTLIFEDAKNLTATEATQPVIFNSWDKSLLKPSQQYLIELKTLNANGGLLKQLYFTFFTSSTPLEVPKPLLITNNSLHDFYTVSFVFNSDGMSWTINANNAAARYITAEIFDKASGQLVNYQRNGASTVKLLTAQTALNNTEMSAFIQPLNRVPYPARMVLVTKDSLGNVIGQGEYDIVIHPRPLAENVSIAIVSPSEGQTNVSLSPIAQIQRPDSLLLFQISVAVAHYMIDTYPADWQGEDYHSEALSNTTSITSWQLPNLKAGTRYVLKVNYVVLGAPGTNPSTGKEATVTFTTQPGVSSSKPLLISPKPDSALVLSERGVFYKSMGTYTVNANNPLARSMNVKVLNAKTGEQINYVRGGPVSEIYLQDAQAATSNVSRTQFIYEGSISEGITGKPFGGKVSIITYDSLHVLLDSASYPITVIPRPFSKDIPIQLLSPTPGQSNVALPVQVRIKHPDTTPFTDIEFVYSGYEIDQYPADWQGSDFRKNTTVKRYFSGSIGSWDIDSLQPGTTYQLKLNYTVFNTLDADPYVNLDTIITFTTRPVISSGKPLLLSPKPDSVMVLSQRGVFGLSMGSYVVNANNTIARSMDVRFYNTQTGQRIDYVRSEPVSLFYFANAQQATSDVTRTLYISTPNTGKLFDARVDMITYDSLHTRLDSVSYAIKILPRPLGKDLPLTFLSPTPGQNNVALPVQVRIQEPTFSPFTDIDISYEYYLIDRYPADWQGSDFRKRMLSTNFPVGATPTWQIDSLQAGTTYQMKLSYLIIGALDSRPYLRLDTTILFTTAPAQGSNPLLLWPANNATVRVCDSTNALFNANNDNARMLSIKVFRNDPRQLLREYSYQLSDAMAATKTIAVPDLFQQLNASGQYLIEVKTQTSSGGLIAQQYFTLFTSGCSSAARKVLSENIESSLHSIVSPNPSVTDFKLQLHSGYNKAIVEVISIDGRIINQYNAQGNSQIQINGNGLQPGMYLIRVKGNDGKIEQFKIVKQ
ncbi:T9SS type A sorting domain-containing protein [Cytophagaceae bacterium DM2B3-1]|uniref:T9SS type A sorting domain-containing protein n=1 Tax=Xanthocytophaga flava TaxID=3048013 RepID=A0ABT7CMD8_9BACT|nr:T9SS type A sorting domain-containing protein [Xanthocytophaga flavus]MDJ1494906.1 T9SS type A sorting domain-containing protein [Xanthocytophaga flavus]